MGKLIYFVLILIFLDLFFLATGQLCATDTCSLSSIIFNTLFNLENIQTGDFWTTLIGNFSLLFSSPTGILSLGIGGAVALTTYLTTKEFRLLLIPMAVTLALITSDFVVLFSYLYNLNKVLSIFVMGPIIIIYILVATEWLIGKD